MSPEVEFNSFKANFDRSSTPISLTFEEAPFGDKEPRTTYLVRLLRPYWISYGTKKSPVCYIGSGRAKRIHDHQQTWLWKLGVLFPNLRGFELWVARPRKLGRGGGKFYQELEADLVCAFKKKTDCIPIFNRRLGRGPTRYDYDADNLFGPGSGPAFSKLLNPEAI